MGSIFYNRVICKYNIVLRNLLVESKIRDNIFWKLVGGVFVIK